MVIGGTQPTLYPWIGYFDLIKKSDVFVFLDNVHFKKQTWHMRNRIKSGSKVNESEFWLHIPTKVENSTVLIKDTLIDNSQDWRKSHHDGLQYNYGKSYKELGFLIDLLQKDWERIVDFNIAFITQCCQYLEIDTKFVRASELIVSGKKSDLILDICKALNGTELIANKGSKVYLEKDRSIFDNENIKIQYHDYKPVKYNQKGDVFINNLSILDLLFTEKQNSKFYI